MLEIITILFIAVPVTFILTGLFAQKSGPYRSDREPYIED